MEFGLDIDQLPPQQTVVRYCADRLPADSMNHLESVPVDRARWPEMAAMGLFERLGDGPGHTGTRTHTGTGEARARGLLLPGRAAAGRGAADWGTIHRAVPEGDLDAAVDALTDELRASATVAVGLTERCLRAALDGGVAGAMANESAALEVSSRSADFGEGRPAFTEHRDTRFEGREEVP